MLLEATKLSGSCIEKLARKEVLAVLVKGFIEPGIAADLTEKILSRGYTHYTNAPSIGRIGMAFYEAEGNPSQVTTYFEQAEKNLTDLRNRCAPLMCPIDLLDLVTSGKETPRLSLSCFIGYRGPAAPLSFWS